MTAFITLNKFQVEALQPRLQKLYNKLQAESKERAQKMSERFNELKAGYEAKLARRRWWRPATWFISDPTDDFYFSGPGAQLYFQNSNLYSVAPHHKAVSKGNLEFYSIPTEEYNALMSLIEELEAAR